VRRAQKPSQGGLREESVQASLHLEVERGRPSPLDSVAYAEILRGSELLPGLAEKYDHVARLAERCPYRARDVLQEPHKADRGGRRDRTPPRGLVVEGDVSRDDRGPERPAGISHPPHRLDELPQDLGMLGVAKVQTVRDGERPGPGHRDVSSGLRDGVLSPQVGVECAVARIRVGRQGQSPVGPRNPDHRGIPSRPQCRGALDELVVLPEDPLPRAEVGRAEQGEQRLA
jgi:hypothetical protein